MFFLRFVAAAIAASSMTACSVEVPDNKSAAKAALGQPQARASERDTPAAALLIYECSANASGTFGVLYVSLQNGTRVTPSDAVRISGLLPILECKRRAREDVKVASKLPMINYYCELDASGSAMLFEQSLALGDKLFASSKKISSHMTKRECFEAAAQKQQATGILWTSNP